MRFVSRRSFLGFLLLASLLAFGAKEFVMPNIYPAKTYPAHDDHPLEKISIAADPYDLADKAAIFNEKYVENGYMPILVVITNDGDQPVALNNLKVQLITKRRDKIPAATEDDLYRRFSKVKRRGDDPILCMLWDRFRVRRIVQDCRNRSLGEVQVLRKIGESDSARHPILPSSCHEESLSSRP
jgi:hypothetical protein